MPGNHPREARQRCVPQSHEVYAQLQGFGIGAVATFFGCRGFASPRGVLGAVRPRGVWFWIAHVKTAGAHLTARRIKIVPLVRLRPQRLRPQAGGASIAPTNPGDSGLSNSHSGANFVEQARDVYRVFPVVCALPWPTITNGAQEALRYVVRELLLFKGYDPSRFQFDMSYDGETSPILLCREERWEPYCRAAPCLTDGYKSGRKSPR